MRKDAENQRLKRNAMLDAAQKLFTDKGLAKTSVSDIVENSGVAKGTFYLSFKDKYDIRNWLISHRSHQILKDAYLAMEQTPLQKLEYQFVFICNHVLDYLWLLYTSCLDGCRPGHAGVPTHATARRAAGVPARQLPRLSLIHILGALIAAIAAKEFKGHGGSSPVLRFVLGAFVMIGALMFLGCPLRMVIRLGGGDLNALVGLVGFIAGILVGIVFLKKGFSLQRSSRQMQAEGAAFPLVLVGLYVVYLLFKTAFTASEEGPGRLHAAIGVALAIGVIVGILCPVSYTHLRFRRLEIATIGYRAHQGDPQAHWAVYYTHLHLNPSMKRWPKQARHWASQTQKFFGASACPTAVSYTHLIPAVPGAPQCNNCLYPRRRPAAGPAAAGYPGAAAKRLKRRAGV